MLDDIPHRLVKQLAAFARRKQAMKSPRSRTTTVVDAAMEKHAQWLALEDIPGPIVCLNWAQGKDVNTVRKRSRMPLGPIATPSGPDSPLSVAIPQRTIRRLPSGGDIFMMDDADGPMMAEVSTSSAKISVWKPHSVPR
jgi:inhibitor of Bruton tyrosine kinase